MAAPAKFLFDTDFGRGGKAAGASAAQHQAAVAEAEQRGYRKGRAEAASDATRALADALAAVSTGIEKISRNMTAVESRMESEAVEVAVAVANKLSTELLRREPFAEVAALAADCFRHLVGAPNVVVRVSPAIFEDAKSRIEEIATSCGFAGRVVVTEAQGVATGDCRLEWADGGMVRDRSAIEAAITDAVERYLAVRGASGGTLNSGKLK